MLSGRQKQIGLAVAVTLALGLMAARACNVPVFRYALERWPAEPYLALVFHREPLTSAQQAVVDSLKTQAQKTAANLEVKSVALTEPLPDTIQKSWQGQSNPPLAWVVVHYPHSAGIQVPAWTGPLSNALASGLTDSPVRQEVARRLLAGQTAVWLLLESGNKAADEAAAQLVATESRKLEKSLQLPESAPDDPPLRTSLPAKIAFSSLRVSRQDPAEWMLVKLLTSPDPSPPPALEPMLVAVFGRGRALPPLAGKEIQAEPIGTISAFLTGACSCEAKSLNPGIDLLMAADWEAGLEEQVAAQPGSSSLESSSPLTAATANQLVTKPALAASTSTPENQGTPLPKLLLTSGIGLLLLALAALAAKLKSGKGP